ncbi:MAG: molybdopterin biosynthesis protein [Deltaproteobacteria bacterium]|nr:molybdopterin biosynthesis protein [Deltaproteobacteria bacterium]
MKRNVYLKLKGLDEAKKSFSCFLEHRTRTEEIPADESLGRVTAEPIFAKRSSPAYHSAAMDGIAVRAEKTYGTTEISPSTMTLDRDAVWINTGQAIPEGYDAVIMIEQVHQLDDNTIELRSPAYPWQHIRKVGEDIVATQLLLPQNHMIRPYDMGALISAGILVLKVRKKPKVAIIPSGSELVQLKELKDSDQLKNNQIIESNSATLAGLVRESHSEPIVYDIVPDEEDKLREILKKAVNSKADLIIINAGSSAGSKDYTANIIAELGEVFVHGVAMMPGKPTILGAIKGKPVVGNPGYTVSSVLSFDQFVRPVLHSMQGVPPPCPQTIQVVPSRNIPSKMGIEEFLRVHIGKVGDRTVATPLSRGAGTITTLTKAEGILRIPALSEGVTHEEEVRAEILVNEDEILNTLVIIGSHDITIDILADEIRRKGNNIRISSGNVGSLGGLLALGKGLCHMAGSHLLDTTTGEYNLSYINRYLKGVDITIINLVMRDQGLMVAKGNPKGITGINDLKRDGITFINRQPGSGTRVLFDYRLEQAGIHPDSIQGYQHEEFTHMAVAADVKSKAADCGMGIFAAAKALDLDFIPVVKEQYDLIVPTRFLDLSNIKVLLETIKTKNFKDRVTALGGYDPAHSGDFGKKL